MNTMQATLVGAVVSVMAGVATAQPVNVLALVPPEAEILARVNVPAVVDSPLMERFLEMNGRQKTEAQINFVQNLTGLNLREDLKEIWVIGLIDQDEKNVLLARGAFDQEKLLTLVQLNETYDSRSAYGNTVHHWKDDGEKFAAFLGEDLLAVTGDSGSMETVLQRAQRGRNTFGESAPGAAVPTGEGTPPFWGMLIRTPETDCDFGKFARSVDLSHVLLQADFAANDSITATMTGFPSKPGMAPQWLKVAEGGLAAAGLYADEDAKAALFAETVSAKLSDDGEKLILEGTAPVERLLELRENAGN